MNSLSVLNRLLRDLVLERLARAENGDLLGRDLDDLLRVLGVASLAGGSLPHFEGPESYELDLLPLGQSALDRAHKGVYSVSRHLLAHVRGLGKLVYKIGLGHT